MYQRLYTAIFFQVFLFAAAELAVVVPTDKLQNDCDKIYYRIPK
jgi:hypothetical protein